MRLPHRDSDADTDQRTDRLLEIRRLHVSFSSARHKSRVVANSVNHAAQVIVEPFDDADPRPMSLEPGQFSMHHGLVPHRSGRNTSDHRRVGLAFHYTPTYARPQTI